MKKEYLEDIMNEKRILYFLVILTLLCALFTSVGVVFSADSEVIIDNNENSSENSVEDHVDNVNISKTSSSSINNNNNFTVTVTHNKVEHGKPITFKVTVKDSNNNPVVGHYFSFSFRSKNDITNPDGRFTNTVFTDENGTFYEYWPGNTGYFDYYELTISDFLDPNKYPSGNIYYYEIFDLTLKPSMSIAISKSTVYEGQYTLIKVTVKVNGIPAEGYLLWKYNKDKSVTTKLNKGVSTFQYNSFILGKNPIVVTYIGLGSAIPGYVVSNINKSFNLNVIHSPNLIISKIVKYGKKYKVTVKNIGKGKSTSTKLKLGYKTKYSTVNIGSLSSTKSKTVVVNFNYNLYKKYKKYAWINYNEDCFEKNYNDNKISFKSVPYIGLLPDLVITKVSRSKNNIIVNVKIKEILIH